MMTTRTRNLRLVCVGATLAMMSLVGCTRYYQITDPNTGSIYYGTNADTSNKAGFVEFTDSFTHRQVTLQSPHVTELTKDQFVAATTAK